MNLFEVAAEGYHTPLTSEEIAELFHAGRLNREDPCKRMGETKWRTIDELFPLLKHDSVSPLLGYWGRERSALPWVPMAAAAFFATAIAFGLIYSCSRVKSSEVVSSVQLPPRESQHDNRVVNSQAAGFAPPTSNLARIAPIQQQGQNAELTLARAEQQRLAREQLQREQAALADQMRAHNQHDEKSSENAAGRNVTIPLNESVRVQMGNGASVSVKIVDNDVTSFDTWINGTHRHEVRKQKGITASGTDETLLYSNGTASLYYVWELSGRLNSCLLRVRER